MRKIFFLLSTISFSLSVSAQQITFNRRYDFNPAVNVQTYTNFCSLLPDDSGYFVSGISVDTFAPYATGLVFCHTDLYGNITSRNLGHIPNISTYLNSANTLTPYKHRFLTSGITYSDTMWRGCLTFIDSSGVIADARIYTLDTNSPHRYFLLQPFWNGLMTTNSNIYTAYWSVFSLDTVPGAVAPFWVWLVKSDSLGNKIWAKKYGIPSDGNFIPSISQIGRDSILLAYSQIDYSIDPWGAASMIRVLLIDSSGRYLGDFYHSSQSQETLLGVYGMTRTRDHGYVLAADKGWQCNSYPYYIYYKGILIKLDSTGREAWRYINPGDSIDTGDAGMRSTIETSDGSIIAAGNGIFFNIADSPHVFMTMAKLDPTGQIKWQRRYTFFGHSDPYTYQWNYSVKECPDKGFILCGRSQNNDSEQGWLVKVDSFGCLIPGCQYPSGISDIDGSAVSWYVAPVPVTTELQMYFDGAGSGYSMELRDMEGRSVQHIDHLHRSTTYTLSTESMASGMYIACLIHGGRVIDSRKIVKQ
jgi:hypothetical protein